MKYAKLDEGTRKSSTKIKLRQIVSFSPNVYGLYVGRFVGGLAVGAFSVGIPPYVEDIAENQLLSTLANFYHVQFACGVLFGYVVGKFHHFLIPYSATWGIGLV
jgi:MFS family permease